ncbi:MAG: DHHW family protein [Angelakisella sp.]
MKKRLLPLAFIFIILSITVTTYLGSPVAFGENVLHNLGHPTIMAEHLERYFRQNLSFKEPLRSLNLALRTACGNLEKDGIFFTDDGLVSHFIPTTDSTVHRKNTREIVSFTKRSKPPAAVMLLPTASAIYQDKLPPFASRIQMNQHFFIEETNKVFSGSAMAIDIYPALFSGRKEYLYSRTDKDLASSGGFLVYEALARRLGIVPKIRQDFRLQFLQAPYYGSLYDAWGYGGVKGDNVTAYHYTGAANFFTVHHWLRYEDKIYHSLYPSEAASDGNVRNVVLGGRSPIITITNSSLSPTAGKLLIFGDSNVMSFLPFLAYHYREITFADPTLLTDSELARINPNSYSQVLFTFSLETYMNTVEPSRAAMLPTAVP